MIRYGNKVLSKEVMGGGEERRCMERVDEDGERKTKLESSEVIE